MAYKNFLTSGFSFEHNERKLKNRYTMINISFILSSLALVYTSIHNFLYHDKSLCYAELLIVSFNVFLLFLLRQKREYIETITTILCFEYLLFFNLLILFHEPSELKHIWIFTYPIVLLFFKDKHGIYWLGAFLTTMFLFKIQPFLPTHYSYYQISYLALELIVISVILELYKRKIDEDDTTIEKQKAELEFCSTRLQEQVDQKTKELLEINQNLERQVAQKVNELINKDRLLVSQSRQAAMGEMISMIAHQWRQPLSNITLQISNLKISSMLGEVNTQDILTKLESISDTILYLSDTIDDFQTYFEPDKEKEPTDVCKIIRKSVNFALPRAVTKNIRVEFACDYDITINTYTNELVQALINIINNAIDATISHQPSNPVIHIEVDECYADGFIEIYIKDNAGGISEDIKEKIFEPYFSTKGKNGTGIGLYMSKMIIDNHLGGEIEVLNQNGGATFRLRVPVN